MALRNLHTDVKSALIENKSLNVFHLVKFEKPSNLPVTSPSPEDYVYLTDAFHDVEYDGSTYTAGGLLKVGTIQETIEAKASTINLEISATKLGANAIANVTLPFPPLNFEYAWGGGATSNAEGTLTIDVDLFKSGFYPGDIITLTDRSDTTIKYKARIDRLHGNGTKVDITALESIPTFSNKSMLIEYANPEVGGLINSGGSDLNYTNYVNREVSILRVYSDPIDGVWIGEPVLLFKGIISKGTLNYKESGQSKIVWNLNSHWADFVRVQGRLTSDENHRGLDASGSSDTDAVLFEEYASDKGFEHADTALNVTATYTGFATRYKQVKRGGLAGLMGMKKLKEEKYEVQRELDLSLNMSAKFIPVVYGVQKIDAIPVFADVVIVPDMDPNDNVADGYTTLYTANVLCEGPIGGIYDIYVDNKSLVCKDAADYDVRGGSSASDIPCLGRMAEGQVLEGGFKYEQLVTQTETSLIIQAERDFANSIQARSTYDNPQDSAIFISQLDSNFQEATIGYKGIQHGKTFEWPQAGGLSLTFHAGLFAQQASLDLIKLSSDKKFKVQTSYYTGTGRIEDYWSPNHRLRDTAYVVLKDEIAEEDGQAPDHSYVVKGKFINCHNYDYTYKSSGTSEVYNSYNIGDSVTITIADGSTSSGIVLEKFYFYDLNGEKDFRIKVKAHDSGVQNSIEKDTAGQIIVSKTGLDSWIMQSDNYTGSSASPSSSTETFSPVKYPTDDISTLSTNITRTTVYTYTELPPVPGLIEVRKIRQKTTLYKISLSGLNTFSKNLLKALKDSEMSGEPIVITLENTIGTSTFSIPLELLDTTNWNIIQGVQDPVFEKVMNTVAGPESVNPFYGYEGDATVTINDSESVSVSLDSKYIIEQDSEDSLQPSISKGLTLTVEKRDSRPITRTLKVPTTQESLDFINTNNILIVDRVYPYNLADSLYSYGSKVINSDNEVFGDLRVSINPAMQLLDYLTSTRYGKGLDLDLIDLDSFKETARACDQQSDITILTTGSYNVGDTYTYPENNTTNPIQFRGTISEVKTVTYNSTSYTQVTFTDVIGKLGKKWFSWKSYDLDTPVWHQSVSDSGVVTANFVFMTTAGTLQNPPSSNTGSLSLYKLGDNNSTILVNTSFGSPEGNPFIKMVDDRGILVSGYSLYDCDDVKYWKYIGWDEQEQRYVTRHQTNLVIDTSKPVFDNVNDMLSQFNGMLRYNNGKYSLSIKTKAKNISDFDENVEIITTDEIIGNIKVDDKGISKTYNAITTAILDPVNDFEPRSLSFFNSTYLKEDKRVQRQGNYQAGGISNYFNARMNIKQVLDESRSGLTISFKMAPKGYLLLAGEVIALNYPKFNWENKLFRISSVNVQNDLLVQIVATEHNDDAYIINNLPSAIVEKYSSGSIAKPVVDFSAPVLATPTNNGKGGVELTWTNSSNFKRASHTVQIWRSNTPSFADAELVGYSKSDVFTDPVITGGQVTRYYWIRYSILQDSASSNTGQPVEKFSPYSPLTTENGLAGTAEPVESAINVTIVSSNGGAVFKNNTGTEKVLSVLAFDAGTGQNVTSQITNYKWYKEGVLITLDGDNRVDPTGTVTADGNFPTIIVGPEDIADGSSELIEVEITI